MILQLIQHVKSNSFIYKTMTTHQIHMYIPCTGKLLIEQQSHVEMQVCRSTEMHLWNFFAHRESKPKVKVSQYKSCGCSSDEERSDPR